MNEQLLGLWSATYTWAKTAHLVFVIAWMAAVFYLPRILVNLAEAGDVAPVRERLLLMGRRLYRFGHVMFGLAFLVGAWLASVSFSQGWLHAKLALVVLLLMYYIVTGRWLKAAAAGRALPSGKALRWFNELPLLLLVGVVWLVVARPF